MSKVLLMSHCVPPIVRSPSIIINRLFKYFPDNSYIILTSHFKGKNLQLNYDLELPCKYYYVDIETVVGGYIRRYFNIFKKWIEVIPIFIKGIKVINKEGCDKILVCPNHGNFLLAAYLMHKIRARSLYVYFFDLFRMNQQSPGLEIFMRWVIVNMVLRSASCIFVMSEKLKEHYTVKYPGIKVVVIRHPINKHNEFCEKENIENNRGYPNRVKKIVFTGMIYEYQIDAIQSLAKAVKELSDVEFHIYTQKSREYLESMGVLGRNIFYNGFVTVKEIMHIQKNADILFLPMSFHGPRTDPDVIKTASPGKISEYLAAERPILVHAPVDSYIAWYARKYGFGLVVDKPDINLLKESIQKLINNPQLRKELVLNAGKVAEMHDISKVLHDFKKGLGMAST